MHPDHLMSSKPTAEVLKKKRNSVNITMSIIRVSLLIGIAACLIVNYSKTHDTVSAFIFDNSIRLTADQMSLLVKELLPLQQQQKLASDPERRKDFAKRLKELLALGQAAENEAFAKTEEVKSQIDLQIILALKDTYEKKNPGPPPTDAEVNAYYQAHPGDWDAFLNANLSFKQRAQGPQGENMKKEYGQMKLIAERASKAGLEQDEATRLRILLGRSQALARAYIANLQNNINKFVTEAIIEAYYNSHKDEFEQARVRHILVSTQEGPDDDQGRAKKPLSKEEARKKAQSLLDRIRKGEDFAKLALKESDDPGSSPNGGDMDFFPKGMMVNPFEDAAFSLKPGEVSEVFETEFGFHIIKIEERRIATITDPQIRQKITQKLQQDGFEKEIQGIADSSKIEVAEDFRIEVQPEVKPKTNDK
jgi:parvulin-like peptidyl-prolyl isomerase